MDKVKFLEDVEGYGFEFKYLQGVEYELVSESDKYYYIKQSDSPKGKNWVTSFPKDCEGKLFQLV